MKLATPDRQVESNMTDATSFAMGIDEDALHLVMDQLAGLYQDQFTAILREYATNAIDAHKMAGIDRPIEITLPTPLQPSLKIRDHGIGLDVDDLRLIYSQYGASTKRQSNDFNGQLGFGCKAALAYSDVFNVTSVKDGVKTFCAISKETGVPMFHVLDQSATTEPNGTTVEVPVGNRQDQHQFAQKARVVYSYFDAGTVLLDGRTVERFSFERKLADDIYLLNEGIGYGIAQSYILMGNVAYPTEIQHGFVRGTSVLIEVPIGAVEFTPAREGLKERHPNTIATKQRIETRIAKLIQGIVQKEVDAAASPREALRVVRQWRNLIQADRFPKQGSLTYKGHPVPTALSPGGSIPKHLDGTDNLAAAPHFTLVSHRSRSMKDHQRTRAIQADLIEDAVWVKGYTPMSFTVTHKKKLVAWAEARYQSSKDASGYYNGPSAPKTYVLCPADPPSFWVESNAVVSWEDDIKPIKLETTTVKAAGYGGRTKPTGAYDGYVDGSSVHVQAGDIDTTKPLFYIHGNFYEAGRYAYIIQRAHPKGYTYVYMPGNRIDKFLRDFPSAKKVQDGAQAAYEAWKKSHTPDQLKALWMSDKGIKSDYATLGGFPGRIDDPEIREAIRIAKIDVTKIDEGRREYRYVARTSLEGVAAKDPLSKYPLLGSAGYGRGMRRQNLDHIVIYLNAAYAAYQKGTLK